MSQKITVLNFSPDHYIFCPDKRTHTKSKVAIVRKVCKTNVFTKNTQNCPTFSKKGAKSGAKIPNFIWKRKKEVHIV